MFLRARADLEARQEEAIANAWAVLESSMMGIRGPENEQTRTPSSIVAEQGTPAVNVLVDAASEQNTQSSNGFSGVQTPSIYLTPAGGVSPVHLNTGNYVTPELFSPANTAYYTAPSTCIPVSARSQTEQTPSFVGNRGVSSSGMESSITPSGVDSGYSHSQNSHTSGVGTPVSNVNGQQTEQGTEQSTRPQVRQELSPASGKPAETEQRKVLVFDTDSEDSDERSGDRKRGRKRASSSKRSTSRGGKDPDRGGRARKTGKDPADDKERSKSKMSKDPAESVDSRKTGKLRRARSASRGRKRKPRKDESSSSSSSSRKRAVSSKKSASKARREPKVIPESN